MAGEASAAGGGKVACAAWIRRREEKAAAAAARVFVAYGRAGAAGTPAALEVLGFDAKECSLSPEPLARAVLREGGAPRGIAVHPAGDELVCTTATGCRDSIRALFWKPGASALFITDHAFVLFPLGMNQWCCPATNIEEFTVRIIPRDAPPLESVGPQKCLAFSTDGAKFAIGGEDGHLRIFHWPNMNVLLDEPKAHKSFRDMDISLDSEFLVSTSTDGSARIWKIDEGAPLLNLTRSSDEKIECCRFSRDGMKPFLFCTVAKGSKVVTVVWNISDWKRIGYKRLLGKPISTLSVSLDGKYLALGSHDGDFCAVDVKKMEVSHWSKKVHLGSPVTSIEFCPTERLGTTANTPQQQ